MAVGSATDDRPWKGRRWNCKLGGIKKRKITKHAVFKEYHSNARPDNGTEKPGAAAQEAKEKEKQIGRKT